MPMRPAQYLPRETLRRSRDLEFRQQTERDLDTFDFTARVETDIAGLKLPALGTVGEGLGADAESNGRPSGRPEWMSGPDRQDAVPAPVQMAAPAGPRPETRPTEIVDETPGATMTPLRGPDDADGQQQPGYQMAGATSSRPAPMPSSGGAPYTPAAGPSTAAGSVGDIDNSSRQSFVRTAWPYALEAAHGDSNLAELILAKAISENGSIGTGRPIWANNFSGIKGEGDAGSVEADTWESVNGQRVNIKDRFAAYSSPRAGFAAFWQFLENNNRYHPALARYQQTRDADQLMRDINAAGYATDPNWAESVRSIRDTQVAPLVRGQQPAPEMRKTGAAEVPETGMSAGDQKRARMGLPPAPAPASDAQQQYPPAPWANEPAAQPDELQYRQPTDQPLDEAPQDAASAGSQTFDAPGYDPAAYEPGAVSPSSDIAAPAMSESADFPTYDPDTGRPGYSADLSVQSGVQYGAEAGEAPYGPPAPAQVDSTYTRAQATPDLDPWAPTGPQPRPPITRDVREGRAAADAAAIARPRSINASAQARIDNVIAETRILMEGAASPEEAEQIRQSALRLIDAIERQATDDQSQARRDEQLRQEEIAASTPAQTPRGYWDQTDRERDAFAAAGDQLADPRPVGPESWPAPVRAGLGRGLGALQGISAASEYVTGRADYLHVPALIRRGIMAEHFTPEQQRRYEELTARASVRQQRNVALPAFDPDDPESLLAQEQATAEGLSGDVEPLTDAELAELDALNRYADRKYQEIKNDPDQINRYFSQAPGSLAGPLVTGLAALPIAGSVAARGAAGAASRLGAGARTARAVGYGADIAVQSAGDPTNLVTQPVFDAAIQGVRGAARAGRAASDALPGPRLPAGAQALPGAGPERSSWQVYSRDGDLLHEAPSREEAAGWARQHAPTADIVPPPRLPTQDQIDAARRTEIQSRTPAPAQQPPVDARAPFPLADDVVDGLRVRREIPNTDSISAGFDDGTYTVLPGIRRVPIDDLGGDVQYANAADNARAASLATAIRESGEINPLIVVADKDGLYVMEGGHRVSALRAIGVREVPALVVIDESANTGVRATPRAGVATLDPRTAGLGPGRVPDQIEREAGTNARPPLTIGGEFAGATIGGLGGAATAPEDATWEERTSRALLGAGLGLGAGGTLGRAATVGSARLLDNAIKAGKLTPEIIATHPDPAKRIMTILALAAEGMDDGERIVIPAIAAFVAEHAPRESARFAHLLSGQATAGEIRQVASRTLGTSFGEQVGALLSDVLTGAPRRALRAGERRADAAAVRGLPSSQYGLIDPRPDNLPGEVWTPSGPARETTDPDIVGPVARQLDALGVRGGARVYVVDSPQPNAFALVGHDGRPAIAVTRGLATSGMSEQAIRGLIAHEAGHIGEDVARAAAGGGRAPATSLPAIPPDVADQIDYPIQIPTSRRAVQAIRNAGGTIDRARGVDLTMIRAHDPEAEGQLATRGGTFNEAGPPGTAISDAVDGMADIGGPVRMEAPTRFRAPFSVDVRDLRTGETHADGALRMLGVPESGEAIADEAFAVIRRTGDDPEARAQGLEALVERLRGDVSLVRPMLAVQKTPDQVIYAVQENVISAAARRAGRDAVLFIDDVPGKRGPQLTEVFTTTEARNPTTNPADRVPGRNAPQTGYALRPDVPVRQPVALPGVGSDAASRLEAASARLREAERAAEDARIYGSPGEERAAREVYNTARAERDAAADAVEAARRAGDVRDARLEAAGYGRPMDEADTLRAELDAPGGQTAPGGPPRFRDDAPRGGFTNLNSAAAGGALGAASEDEDATWDERAARGLVGAAIGTAGAKRGPKIAVDPKRVAAEVARGPHIGARLNRELKPPASSVPISVRVAGKLTDAKAPQAWAEDVLRGMAGKSPLPASSADRPSALARVNPGSVADERIRAELEGPITRAAEAGLQDELPGYLDDLAQQDALDSAYQAGREAFEAKHTGKMPASRLERGADRAGQAAMRRAQQGGPGGTYEDIVARVEATRERATTAGTVDALDEAAEAVWEHNRQTLARLRDAGDISQAEHDAILAAHPHLVPTVPIMGLDPSGAGPTGRVLNRFGGQGKGERLNPIVASRNLTVEAERAAAKNQVFTAFSRLIDDAVNAGGLTLDGSRRLWDGNVPVSGMIDGKPTTYYLPRPVADALESAGAQGVDSNAWSAILKRVGGFVTSTITAARASFLPVNLARDVQDYATRTAAKEGGPHKIPAVLATWADEAGKAARDIMASNANVRGGIGAASGAAAGAVQGDEDTTLGERVRNAASGAVAGTFLVGANKSKATGAARELAARGGGMGRLDSGWRAGQRWYRDVLRDGGQPVRTPGDAARWLGDWAADIATLQGVKGINERTELISRTAAMRRADQRGAGVTEAMIAGRDATVDFDRGGTVIRAANGIIPFLNATVQGGAQTVRLFRDHPKEATAVMLATLGPSLIAAEAWNRSDPERARVYDDVPQYVKDSGLVVVLPWAGSDARGERPNYLWIPTGMATPFMIAGRDALLANAPGLEPTAGRVGIDPDAPALIRWGSILSEVASVFSPVKGDSPAALASSVVPPVGKQLLELGLNRDMYRGAPVASPSADERASAFSQGVSGAANAAGRMLGSDALQNVRPSQVEYLTRQLPAYGDIVTGASDMIAPRPSRADDDRPIQDAPFMGGIANRFVRDTGGANLDRAQDGRLTDGARSVLEEAGLPPSTVKPVPSSYRGAPLSRDEQLRWQEATNAVLDDVMAAARDSAAWDDPAKREQAVSRAITRARDLAAREALSELTDAEIRDRIERAAARKAG